MSVRFAPSPTGAFHIGNFRTAWVSWAWARALRQTWVVRFEDIDLPRVIPGSHERQLFEMKELGLIPDRVQLQSEKRARHWELFERARHEGVVYPCRCSRKQVLNALASAPHGTEALYSGHCRNENADASPSPEGIAWRFRDGDSSGHKDFIAARAAFPPSEESFTPAYHWACAIDDWDDGHDLLVRAFDLLSATPIQRKIQTWLRGPEKRSFPAVFHTSLIVTDSGGRLEKRTHGVTLPEVVQNGFTPNRLLELFSASFHPQPEHFVPEKIWGESRDRVLLAELGLTL